MSLYPGMELMPTTNPVDAVLRAGNLTVGEVLVVQARKSPQATALVDGKKSIDFATLNDRVNRLAHVLAERGVGRGTRVAVLSENRSEYIEAAFAAAKLGAILCALNWRLARAEMVHCISLVQPTIVLMSPRFEEKLAESGWSGPVIRIDADYEALLKDAENAELPVVAEPEDGLLIVYTSGTTGFPKGALISHRAEMARMDFSRIDGDLEAGDNFIAWAPMFHMVSIEHSIHVLGLGGKVFIIDGAKIPEMVDCIEAEKQWWVVVLPGMVDELIEELKRRNTVPAGVKRVGCLPDLIPGKGVSEVSRLLRAPFWNTFGSTETGMIPFSGGLIPAGAQPDLAKSNNSMCTWRLVDEDDNEVPRGQPGEVAVRAPTMFSGYWNAAETTAKDFRGGYFHMGDIFVELPDGRFRYVDRSKYLIKSGGENIYPLEIERVLHSDPGVIEAVVVRKKDDRWGEVPVAFVAVEGDHISADYLIALCRKSLSTYKAPREIRFVKSAEEFPRSTSGKVQRQLVELWLT
jgi:acyl-CoA synthetase (AMP-forming)/AMP-acid ligase II